MSTPVADRKMLAHVRRLARKHFETHDLEEPRIKAWMTRKLKALTVDSTMADCPIVAPAETTTAAPTEAQMPQGSFLERTTALGERITDAGRVVEGGRQDMAWPDFYKSKDVIILTGDKRPKDHAHYYDPEKLVQHYGLHSIEFGNWMTQLDRAQFLYGAAAAMASLQSALPMFTMHELAMNGHLSIALGARGHGRAMGHYEPMQRSVINLTRTSGHAGVFGHEWAHALDNYVSSLQGKKFASGGRSTSMLTDQSVVGADNLAGAWERFFAAMYFTHKVGQAATTHKTAFAEALADYPDYWRHRCEVWARTMEVYLFMQIGESDPFLCNNESYYARTRAYPSIEQVKIAKKAILEILTRSQEIMRREKKKHENEQPETVETTDAAPPKKRSTSEHTPAPPTTPDVKEVVPPPPVEEQSSAREQHPDAYVGDTTDIETQTETIPATYQLVELDALIASHNEHSFSADRRYPESCQQRDYTRDPAEQQKVIRNAQNLNPRFLVADTPTATDGPPIVARDESHHDAGLFDGASCTTLSGECDERVMIGSTPRVVNYDGMTFRIEPKKTERDGRYTLVHYVNAAGREVQIDKRDGRRALRSSDLKRYATHVKSEALDRQSMLFGVAPRHHFIVLGGNSRTMSLKLSTHYEKYRSYLERAASLFGFTAAQVQSLTRPVLVRVVDVDMKKCATYSNMLNKSLTQDVDQTTQSVSLARQLDTQALTAIGDMFEQAGTDSIAGALNDPKIVKSLMSTFRRAGIVTDQNVSTYLDPMHGTLTKQGRMNVEGILLGAVLPDRSLIESARNYTDRILRALPLMVRMTRLPEAWNLTNSIQDAIRHEATRRAANIDKWSYIRQTSFDRESIAQPTIVVWDQLDAGANKFRSFLQKFIATAEAEAQREQYGSTLIHMDPVSLDQAVDNAAGLRDDIAQNDFYTMSDIVEIPLTQVPLYKLLQFLGRLNTPFRMTIWGPEGSGKSTFKLMLESDLERSGTVLDVMTEESIRAGRVGKRMQLTSSYLTNTMFNDKLTLPELVNVLRSNEQIKYVVVDSISEWDVSEDEIVDLYKAFPDVNFVFVIQGLKDGKMHKGFPRINYLVDTVIRVDENGVATTTKHRDDQKGRTLKIFGLGHQAPRTAETRAERRREILNLPQ